MHSLTLEPKLSRQTQLGVHIVITGTEGALRVTNARGFSHTDDNIVI